MLNYNVLIVDDDKRIRTLLKQIIVEKGYRCHGAANASEARQMLSLHNFDILILDIMMPGESGYQLLEFIRSSTSDYADVPIIFLSAKDALDERVTGLKKGADDYIAKPFEPDELLVRIEVLLRRVNKTKRPLMPHTELGLGEFKFSMLKGKLLHGSQEVLLSSSEEILLKVLAQRINEPFTRDELAQRIGHQVSSRSVDVQITRLRKKIKDNPPRYIKTIRHLGYALCPD